MTALFDPSPLCARITPLPTKYRQKSNVTPNRKPAEIILPVSLRIEQHPIAVLVSVYYFSFSLPFSAIMEAGRQLHEPLIVKCRRPASFGVASSARKVKRQVGSNQIALAYQTDGPQLD